MEANVMCKLAEYMRANPDGYRLDAAGVIRNPGKFEGETLAAPYFYGLGCEGWSSFDDADGAWWFELDAGEKLTLGTDARFLVIHESDSGFVSVSEEEAYSPEEDASADEPDEDAITTEDHRRFYQYGKLVLSLSDDADHKSELRAFMEREQFWPGCWFISDHGNAHPIDLSASTPREGSV